MAPETVQIVVQILLALGGLSGLAALVTSRSSSKKIKAEAASTLAEAAIGMVPHLREEIEAMTDDLRKARHRIRQLETDLESAQDEVKLLRKEISKARIEATDPGSGRLRSIRPDERLS